MLVMRYRLTRDMKEAAAAPKLPLAKSAVILRQVVADAPGQGTTVWDMGRRLGAEQPAKSFVFDDRARVPGIRHGRRCDELVPDAHRISRSRHSRLREPMNRSAIAFMFGVWNAV